MDWDCPAAIDFEKFRECLTRTVEQGLVVKELGKNRPDFENFQALDSIGDLVQEIKSLSQGREILLLDGFMLYWDAQLEEMFDLKLFLHAPKHTLLTRRISRPIYVTEQGTWSDPPNYFDDVVWPNYLQYNQRVFNDDKENYVMIDTLKHSQEEMIQVALETIRNALKN